MKSCCCFFIGLPFTNIFFVLFSRRMYKVNPMYFWNIPTGVPGYWFGIWLFKRPPWFWTFLYTWLALDRVREHWVLPQCGGKGVGPQTNRKPWAVTSCFHCEWKKNAQFWMWQIEGSPNHLKRLEDSFQRFSPSGKEKTFQISWNKFKRFGKTFCLSGCKMSQTGQ